MFIVTFISTLLLNSDYISSMVEGNAIVWKTTVQPLAYWLFLTIQSYSSPRLFIKQLLGQKNNNNGFSSQRFWKSVRQPGIFFFLNFFLRCSCMGVDISWKTFVRMVSLFNHNRNTLLKSENSGHECSLIIFCCGSLFMHLQEEVYTKSTLGLSSILPVSMNQQKNLTDYRYRRRPKISIYMQISEIW